MCRVAWIYCLRSARPIVLDNQEALTGLWAVPGQKLPVTGTIGALWALPQPACLTPPSLPAEAPGCQLHALSSTLASRHKTLCFRGLERVFDVNA